jgi:hypothetical protein
LEHKPGLERKLEHTAVQEHKPVHSQEGKPADGKPVVGDNHYCACDQKGHGRHYVPSNQCYREPQPIKPLST